MYKLFYLSVPYLILYKDYYLWSPILLIVVSKLIVFVLLSLRIYYVNKKYLLIYSLLNSIRGYALFCTDCVVLLAFNIGLSDTAVMDMMVSTLQQQRAVTEQLRREAAIMRIPVSVAVADIIRYINEHEQEDCLLVGFSSQKVNPFREKSSCTVL